MAIALANSHGSPIPSVGFVPSLGRAPPSKLNMWSRFGFGRLLHHRDESTTRSPPTGKPVQPHRSPSQSQQPMPKSALARRLTRKVGVSLPRIATFKRQNSERRDRLAPADPDHRRAFSVDRRRPLSLQRARSPPAAVGARLSAPEISWQDQVALATIDDALTGRTLRESPTTVDRELLESIPSVLGSDLRKDEDPAPTEEEVEVDDSLEWELEQKWILNLSMHFRDKSEREKFFVTYAETPHRWRRVTISCDYRGAPPDSLEQDLKELHYQRDKSARIYESIRDSLPEIQFYDTVTNLKLETSEGRLHVHVTEDVNEIIPYPPVSSVRHLDARLIPEPDLRFDGHLSGFVYKVRLDGKTYIKKEIPGPDTVDEFLYEINALRALSGSRSVIGFEGIVVDEQREVVKGLLISYAEQGALVDVLYDHRGQLTLARRERWAKQIVQGLCEIHEAGYVQGDFTLSNVVIDGADNAKIIDINRRGCPVGWEPPEIGAKIESNQRIAMYIGVKSDLFQLGMTLWALAMQEDEPERRIRPLTIPSDVKAPDYLRQIVSICLSDRPQDRLSAKELLTFFPPYLPDAPNPPVPDPAALGLDDDIDVDDHLLVVPRYSRSPTSLSLDRSVTLDDDDHMTPNVVYVTPDEYYDSLSSPRDDVDYPPRGRQPTTYSVRLSDLETPSLSPHPYRSHFSESVNDGASSVYREPAAVRAAVPEDKSVVEQDNTPHLEPSDRSAEESPSDDRFVLNVEPATLPPPSTPKWVLGEDPDALPEDNEMLPILENPASLFASQLPINPAFESQEIPTIEGASFKVSPNEQIESFPLDSTSQTLPDPQLPINPAQVHLHEVSNDAKFSQTTAQPVTLYNLDSASLEIETAECSSLLDSRLPINPAIKTDDAADDYHPLVLINQESEYAPTMDMDSGTNEKPFEGDSLPSGDISSRFSFESTSETLGGHESLTSSSEPLLSSSILPINPAASSLCLDESCSTSQSFHTANI